MEFDDLEDLLTESLAQRLEVKASKDRNAAERAIVAERRRRAAGTEVTSAERANLNRQILDWESRVEWETKAIVAMFHTQVCECGAAQDHLEGLYLRQHHRERPNTRRLVLGTPPGESILALERAYRHSHTTICPFCADVQGFTKVVTFEEGIE